jgi:hypothetical protein
LKEQIQLLPEMPLNAEGVEEKYSDFFVPLVLHSPLLPLLGLTWMTVM